MSKRRGLYRILVGKSEGKRSLGRTKRIWEDNIKMDLQEVRWGHGLDLSGSECGNEPSGSIKCGEFLD